MHVLALFLALTLDKATLDKWMQELSNWGRWGKSDQAGAVNLITPAKRKEAAKLVREGFTVSLSRDGDTVKAIDNGRPLGFSVISSGIDPDPLFAMETLTMSYHGTSLTHLDSLAHMFYQGKVYNGYSKEEINAQGAGQLAVTAYKGGIVTRGVLMDIPKLKGVTYLEASTPITDKDLDAWEKKSGVRVKAGDVVFVRTGRWLRRSEKGPWDTERTAAGMHVSCARWFKKRDVAMVGSDTHGELMPPPVTGVRFPLHQLLLIAMGTPMLDNCDLEALSAAAAERKRWEFMITIAPLVVPRGTGSPVNPLATF